MVYSNRIGDISNLALLTSLTNLEISQNNISDLGPLSSLEFIDILSLFSNQIRDIAPLSELTTLRILELGDNSIQDVSPLSGLIFLEVLSLPGNQITDITPLVSLNKLWLLDINDNQVDDIAVVSSLTGLQWLWMESNRIQDLSALRNLSSLMTLRLQNNQIDDLSALVDNENLSAGDSVYVSDNPLNESALYTQIPALRERGVAVLYPNIPPRADAGPDQEVQVGTEAILDASGSSDPDGDELSYLWYQIDGPVPVSIEAETQSVTQASLEDPGTYRIVLAVSDKLWPDVYDTLTVEVLRANDPPMADAGTDQSANVGDVVALDGSGSSGAVRYSWAEGVENPVTGILSDNEAESPTVTLTEAGTYRFILVVHGETGDSDPDEVVVTVNSGEAVLTFADTNLEIAVREAIGKSTGSILPADVSSLQLLDANSRNISNLQGIEQLTQLLRLELFNNQITDVSPLSGLTQLDQLFLSGNQISDVTPLAGLIRVETLLLAANQIGDVSPLSGLIQVGSLLLDGNQISDVSSLVDNGGLGEGDTVDLRGNPLSDEALSTQIPALQARGVEVEFDEP